MIIPLPHLEMVEDSLGFPNFFVVAEVWIFPCNPLEVVGK
jgi:hypothetical protein